MRYIFYYRHKYDLYDKYFYREKTSTRNLPLEYLFDYLYGREQDERLRLEEDSNDPRRIILWATSNIKEALTYKSFDTYDIFLEYVDRYHKYGCKRFAEMPAIRISRENYEYLKQQFEELRNRKPQYLIMREHDDGHVDMLEKDELSDQDITIMNREYKIYQNYIKRWEAYQKAHLNRYPVWRSPEDNEFESDFALYDPVDEQGVD
jgi:hypothetical protein